MVFANVIGNPYRFHQMSDGVPTHPYTGLVDVGTDSVVCRRHLTMAGSANKPTPATERRFRIPRFSPERCIQLVYLKLPTCYQDGVTSLDNASTQRHLTPSAKRSIAFCQLKVCNNGRT